MREGDFTAIDSSIKKWLYADVFFKPEQLLLYRAASQGGLGLVSVKLKSQALFIRNFMDLAANSKYLHSQYLNILYRAKVLEEEIATPALPPYLDASFFDTIKSALNLGYPISTMKTRHWYRFLHQQEFSKIVNGEVVALPCKFELLNPGIEWSMVCTRLKIPAMNSNLHSFAWKLVHRLLPCESLLNRRAGTQMESCRFFCPNNQIADLHHCLLQCELIKEVGLWIIKYVRRSDLSAEVNDILCLNFSGTESLVWVVVYALKYNWDRRTSGKHARLNEFLCSLMSSLQTLSTAGHENVAEEALLAMRSV